MIVTGESRFVENRAADGGAICVSGTGASLELEGDVLFKANIANRRGGAVFVSEATRVTIRDAFFVDNEAKSIGGGALFAEVGDRCRVERLSDHLPQDLRKKGVDIEVSSSIFARNRASGYGASGGGMRLQGKGVRCTLSSSVTFALNSAQLDGGAMHISDQASTTIRHTTFVGNEAMVGGGAAVFILVSP